MGLAGDVSVIGWLFAAPSLLHRAVENFNSINTGEGAQSLPDFHKSCGFNRKRGFDRRDFLRPDLAPVS